MFRLKFKKLFTQIFLTYLLLVVFSIVMLAFYEQHVQSKFYQKELKSDLTSRANLVASALKNTPWNNGTSLDSLIRILSRNGHVRITLIRSDGKVLSDSHKEAALMDNHAQRPEIVQARQSGRGYSMRYSHTLHKELVYLAIPLKEKGRTIAFLRVALPYASYRQSLRDLQRHFLFGGFFVIILTALISYFTSRRISQPLEEIKQRAQQFAHGEFSSPLPEKGSQEIRTLVRTLNAMGKEIDRRIKTISLQRSEREAMFRSMQEGIIAVDHKERIILLNPAARNFFAISEEKPEKKKINQVLKHKDILEFIRHALHRKAYLEQEVTIQEFAKRYFRFSSAPLLAENGQNLGVLIVVNDVTKLIRLDRMRQDFVANVSHELKTPITTITGYVETLRDENLDEATRRRFLDVIARNSDRMNAIINDLLQLSRLEHGGDQMEKHPQRLHPILKEAVATFQKAAEKKNITLTLNSDETIRATVNGPLLSQAVTNLLDNAIKYSPEGGQVAVSLFRSQNTIRIAVKDTGVGIDPKYHQRIFQRFYRVDKARSRQLGGTGLGLSIVKHIVLAHNGFVKVESSTGRGSTFTIVLPDESSFTGNKNS